MSVTPRIMIIDDDEEVRTAIENLVQSYGFEACTFASAEEFIESCLAERTTCLISDIQMPGMSGVELQALLLDQGRHIPTIFITASPEERLRRQVEASGAVGFLGKPIDASALMDCVGLALAQR